MNNKIAETYLYEKAGAERTGFATFNEGTHLCVKLPDVPRFTISARTSDGRRITFAFIALGDEGKPATICDVTFHDNGNKIDNGGSLVPAQRVTVFTTGNAVYSGKPTDDQPPSLVSFNMERDPKPKVAHCLRYSHFKGKIVQWRRKQTTYRGEVTRVFYDEAEKKEFVTVKLETVSEQVPVEEVDLCN